MMKKQIEIEPNAPKAAEPQGGKTVSLDLIEMLGQFISIDKDESAESILQKLRDFFGLTDDNELKAVLSDSGVDIQALLDARETVKKTGDIKDRAFIFAEKLLSRWLEYIENVKQDDVLNTLGMNKKTADIILKSMGVSRQEYWSGLLSPSAGDLPNPGIKPKSLMSPALAGATSTTWETLMQ